MKIAFLGIYGQSRVPALRSSLALSMIEWWLRFEIFQIECVHVEILGTYFRCNAVLLLHLVLHSYI